jgi:endonuclease IV
MIKIGPAGSDGLGNLKGIRKAARMKLDCMEVEFTYGVRMSMDAARAVGALAKEKGITLSVHAPSWIPAKGPPRLAPAVWFFMPDFIRRKRLSRLML